MYNIVIPTYNERENIPVLLRMIEDCMNKQDTVYQIIVVDDGSTDGTYEYLQNCNNPNIRLIYRKTKQGLGSAYKSAMEYCMYPYTIIMDGDLSHDPSYIKHMIRLQKEENLDIVLTSRYIKYGGVYGWPFYRKVVSRGANDLACLVLNMDYSDLTGSFRLYKTSILNKLLSMSESSGYSIQMELIYNADKSYCKVGEVPIIFYERCRGKSKLGCMEIVKFVQSICNLFVKQFTN